MRHYKQPVKIYRTRNEKDWFDHAADAIFNAILFVIVLHIAIFVGSVLFLMLCGFLSSMNK